MTLWVAGKRRSVSTRLQLAFARKAVEGYRSPRRFATGKAADEVRQVLEGASPLALWARQSIIQAELRSCFDPQVPSLVACFGLLERPH